MIHCRLIDVADKLDSSFHKGFTIGRGKIIYWYIIWHSTGSATVYHNSYGFNGNRQKRFCNGDEKAIIHFKNQNHPL